MAILPKPIWPIFILSLGGFFPITDDGIIVGRTNVPATAAAASVINFLLFIVFVIEISIKYKFRPDRIARPELKY